MTLHWHRMTARERDAAVAELIMGWTRHTDKMCPTDNRTIGGVLYCAPGFEGYNGGSAGHFNVVPWFTTSPADCALVKAKLVEIGHLWRINAQIKSFYVSEHGERFDAYGDTEEEAFCIYALRALGVTVETGECA